MSLHPPGLDTPAVSEKENHTRMQNTKIIDIFNKLSTNGNDKSKESENNNSVISTLLQKIHTSPNVSIKKRNSVTNNTDEQDNTRTSKYIPASISTCNKKRYSFIFHGNTVDGSPEYIEQLQSPQINHDGKCDGKRDGKRDELCDGKCDEPCDGTCDELSPLRGDKNKGHRVSVTYAKKKSLYMIWSS